MQTKIANGIRVLYAAFILFGIVGTLVKPSELPLIILLMTVVFWGAGRILQEGGQT